MPAQDRVRGDQQPQPLAAGFRYHAEKGRQEGPIRPVQLQAARLLPLQDVYRFRTRRSGCDLQFGRMSRVGQDRGLCLFASSI